MSNNTKQKTSTITTIIKRNGDSVAFDLAKISKAAQKALIAAEEGDSNTPQLIANTVLKELEILSNQTENYIPNVEEIQDLVEKALMLEGYTKASKSYILFRQKRAESRVDDETISSTSKESINESKPYFKNALSEFVYYRTYARWREDLNRRETWVETIQRFMDFMKENVGDKLTAEEYKNLHESILNQEVVPSMRLVWSAGKAARSTNVAAYNCSFIAPSKLQDFGEIMYILMCGTGVGFSVEGATVAELPEIKMQTGKILATHVVEDSKEGWADAFVYGLNAWFEGNNLEFDYSKVRPKGARLATMGGRASGPDPLIELMNFSRALILKRQGSRLTSMDVHDIVCKIGEIVVAGGVRRSALISLSDLNDSEMRNAKEGQFWNTAPHRSMSNNSAIYTSKPEASEFMEEWVALAKSGTGERGIFNRGGLAHQLPERRWETFKDHVKGCGTNPCGEIILRSKQFCNLTSIVVRPTDTMESLKEKIKQATILGTYQASLTKFPYIEKTWRENCEEEALLGVSLTGYWDNSLIRKASTLKQLRNISIRTNKEYAKRLGINQSTCVTCIKPSGNSSQLLDTASGMHPRHAHYYIRRVRINATDPLFKMLKDQGVPFNPEVGQEIGTAVTYVLDFPVKAPEDAIVKNDIGAIELLDHWKNLKTNFTEHNPSATISVADNEWIDVAKWVYDNWEVVGGLTFLPKSEHVYRLAPYEECDKATYDALTKRLENVDFTKLVVYERQDQTTGSKEFACVGGGCEI